MEILQLRYFFESAKTGNFTETAKKYMVPTTSVSAAVKRLEKEIGCKLFDRSSNRVSLNANGKRLQQSLYTVFTELDGVIAELSANIGDDREIKMLVRAMRRDITKLITEFNQKHPYVVFKTVFDFRDTDLSGYDIIIDEKSDRYPEYRELLLFNTSLRLKCAVGHPLCGRKLTLRQLNNQKYISMGEDSNMHKILTQACNRVGFAPDVAIMCNDIECYEKLIASGMGIGAGRESGNYSSNTPLECLDVEDFRERYSVCVYYKEAAYYGNIRSFIDFLKMKQM
ncbi:MAG: LysR family transcriptional regulator [Ruminococcaceae bacterium]|nr:LysR family transcriptional regulator [Oscillospiraceae bacterium]